APAASSWRLVLDIQIPTKELCALSYSPDGKLLAVGGRMPVGDSNPIHLFDTASGKEVRRIAAGQPVTSVAFSPDGKTLAFTRSHAIILADASAGRIILQESPKEAVPHLATFTRDGKNLFFAASDTLVRWNPSTGKRLWEIRDPHLYHFAVSSDGKMLALGTAGFIQLVDALTGREIRRLDNGKGITAFVTFSPDGKQLAATTDGNVS